MNIENEMRALSRCESSERGGFTTQAVSLYLMLSWLALFESILCAVGGRYDRDGTVVVVVRNKKMQLRTSTESTAKKKEDE